MLHLGEIEERSKAGALGGPEGGMVMEEVEAEVHEAAGRRFAVDEDMGLWQVPAPRPNKELGNVLLIELVDPVPGLVMEAYSPIYSISKIDMASHQVLPAW